MIDSSKPDNQIVTQSLEFSSPTNVLQLGDPFDLLLPSDLDPGYDLESTKVILGKSESFLNFDESSAMISLTGYLTPG